MSKTPVKKNNANKYKYVFGPAPSRRLGLSLGLDLVPFKTCTLDCLYCEVGRTTTRTIRRFNRHLAEDILGELKDYLDSPGPKLDYITLAGCGEPTLNAEIGRIIEDIKIMTPIKVAVLTNGTLLYREKLRRELAQADLILPSLDTAREKTFLMLNRPHPALDLERIIEGMVIFRERFGGQIWLEALLCKGLNDQMPELEALHEAATRINPDRIQLNTVFRPPANITARRSRGKTPRTPTDSSHGTSSPTSPSESTNGRMPLSSSAGTTLR